MGQRKSRIKRSTLGLIIICVLLVAALGGTIAYYTITINNKENQLNSLNDQLNTLNDQLNTLKSFIATITEETNSSADVATVISDLNGTFNEFTSMYTSTIDSLNAALNLSESTILVNNQTVSEPAAELGSWYNWTFSPSTAGYLTVNVSSASTESWAYTEYSAYGVNYSNQINVGTNGTACFPILPSLNMTVGVGNVTLTRIATQTVTITYYY
jgi:uncharacterized phage infection (PIP) family protein YhgE